MSQRREVVITGLGVVSPLGIGREPFWDSLIGQRSGVRKLELFDYGDLAVNFGGEISQFEPKQYVRPRKSLKVMSRDIQIGFAAADLACRDAGLDAESLPPERLSVVFGADMIYCDLSELADAYNACIVDGEFIFSLWGEKALPEMRPLWMLKYLPNMIACHVGIGHDARGSNNTITIGEVSSLLAISEAMRVIERGGADVVIAGGGSSRNHPSVWTHRDAKQISHRSDNPAAACRPFDTDRDGMVSGEGAAAFILESREHAEARRAKIMATILGYSSTYYPPARGEETSAASASSAIARGLQTALQMSGITAADVGHVNAHGLSTIDHDRIEAAAIAEALGDCPVTAPKSFFGNLGAASGAVELCASLLALEHGQIPVTLNHDQTDPQCPIQVVAGQPQTLGKPIAIALNQAPSGQSAALVIAGA